MTDTFASGAGSPRGGSRETPRSPGDVTSTLAELERKLRELEQELTSLGRRGSSEPKPLPEPSPAQEPTREATAGRLIDEAAEPPRAPAAQGPSAPITRQSPPSAGPSDAQLAGLAELRRFRDRLEGFAGELVEDYEQLLERVLGALTSAPPSAPSEDEILFEGRVELGVGPFYDIGSLSSFERRVAELPHSSDVSVRRFEASHAVLDLRLNAPIALVRELRGLLDIEFSVREIAGGRLMLTFDDL